MTHEALTQLEVASIDASMWGDITRDRPLLSLPLLQECAAGRAGSLVVLAFGPVDAPEAVIVGVRTDRDAERPVESLLFGRAGRLAARLRLLGSLLVVGSPIGQDSGIAFRAAAPLPERVAVLCDALERWSTNRRLGTSLLAVRAADAFAEALPAAWRSSASFARTTAELEVRWQDFDGYLATLRSRNTRGTVRSERNRNARSGVVIRSVGVDAVSARALQRFGEAHYRRKNGVDAGLPADMLERALPRMADHVTILEAVRAGTRCAMLAVVRSGRVAWPGWLGIEAADRPNDFTYFNLGYYELVHRAPALGIERILYGNSVIDAKLARGASRMPMRFVVRPRSLVRKLLTAAALALHRRLLARKFG